MQLPTTSWSFSGSESDGAALLGAGLAFIGTQGDGLGRSERVAPASAREL